jgi:hypothetical protein
LVRIIGEGMKSAGRTAKIASIDVRVGALLPLSSDFRSGLQQVVDEVVAVDQRLNHFERIDITIYRTGDTDIIGTQPELAANGTRERTYHIVPAGAGSTNRSSE